MRAQGSDSADYLFFLRHPEGVRLAELCDHRTELTRLYDQISGSGNREATELGPPGRPVRKRPARNLSRIRKALVETLSETLAGPYQITGEPGEVYRIRLELDLIKQES